MYQVGIALCTNPRISAGPLAWMRYRRSPGASNSLRINLSSASVNGTPARLMNALVCASVSKRLAQANFR